MTAHWKAKTHRAEYDRMRERIVLAAWSFACDHGFHRLTLNAVASQAGCARSSVYRYFDNKEQLLGAVLQDRVYRLGQELEQELQRWPEHGEQMVRGLYLAVCEFRHSPALELLRTLLVDDEQQLADIVLDYIPRIASDMLSIDPVFAEARAAGQVREGVSDDDIMRWLVTVGLTLAQQSMLDDDPDAELAFLRKMLLPSIFAR